ncbi:MAG: tRNA (adenosine(37)-N6)-threonylcarbamoyltransferase complex ATPase subunit type 1 TsaE [Paludibacter sp.]|nr:tRNA (adenosine(37)-N6)-threonylcarbamoyltransferase complex ATPase subunit type 1 TsaE [Paludibacter sp.]
MSFTITSLSEIHRAARQFVDFIGKNRVFSFEGAMGAGKTTFIKAVCQALGVNDEVNSPTFSIVNEYRTTNGETVYHFDFYRINNIREALDIGIEDYFFSGAYCFLEWAENIAPLLPDSIVKVEITEVENGKRRVCIFGNADDAD